MKNTKNMFITMSLGAMLMFSEIMAGSVFAEGGGKKYAQQAQLDVLRAKVAKVEENMLEEIEKRATEQTEKYGTDVGVRESYMPLSKAHAQKVNKCLRIYEAGIETEDVIVKPTVAEDMPELTAGLKRECDVCNFGGFSSAELGVGLADAMITGILQNRVEFTGFVGLKGSITFKFTVILKETKQAIGQYIITYSANWPVECVQHFCEKAHASEFFKGVEILQDMHKLNS